MDARERIFTRIAQLDEGSLRELEEWLDARAQATVALPGVGAVVPTDSAAKVYPQRRVTPLNRRRFLRELAVGGVVLVSTNAATAYLAHGRGTREGSTDARIALEPELARLQRLVKAYQRLEAVGLDEALGSMLAAIGPKLDALCAAARTLGALLSVIDGAVAMAEGMQARAKEGLGAVAQLMEQVEQRVTELWKLVGEITGVAVPLLESVRAFFNSIISKIPFGVGAKIQQVVEWITSLIAAIPELLAQVKMRILLPLGTWLDEESPDGLRLTLLEPLRGDFLTSIRQMLAEVESLKSRWDELAEQALRAALAERTAIRAEVRSPDLGPAE